MTLLTLEQKIDEIFEDCFENGKYYGEELNYAKQDVLYEKKDSSRIEFKQAILSLLEEEKIITKQQMKANVWTKFKLEMIKQDLSARPQKGTRFRTPLEDLTLILEQEAPLNDLDRLQALKQPKKIKIGSAPTYGESNFTDVEDV